MGGQTEGRVGEDTRRPAAASWMMSHKGKRKVANFLALCLQPAANPDAALDLPDVFGETKAVSRQAGWCVCSLNWETFPFVTSPREDSHWLTDGTVRQIISG